MNRRPLRDVCAMTAALILVTFSMFPEDAGAQASRRFRTTIDFVQTGGPTPDPAGCTASEPDRVTLEGTGTATQLGPVSVTASHCILDDPSHQPFVNGEMTMTGGTGDYAGATGSGTLEGTAESEPGRATTRLTGRISIP